MLYDIVIGHKLGRNVLCSRHFFWRWHYFFFLAKQSFPAVYGDGYGVIAARCTRSSLKKKRSSIDTIIAMCIV